MDKPIVIILEEDAFLLVLNIQISYTYVSIDNPGRFS